MAIPHQGRRSHVGSCPPPPPTLTERGQYRATYCPFLQEACFLQEFQFVLFNYYCIKLTLQCLFQMSRVLNSLLSIVRRQNANLIILPWVLCLVPRVTTCRFYIDTAFQLVHVNKIRAVTGISISLRSKKFIYKVQITTLVQNYNVRSLYYCHAFKTRKASKYFQF